MYTELEHEILTLVRIVVFEKIWTFDRQILQFIKKNLLAIYYILTFFVI